MPVPATVAKLSRLHSSVKPAGMLPLKARVLATPWGTTGGSIPPVGSDARAIVTVVLEVDVEFPQASM